MVEIKAPNKYPKNKYLIFLAGSIDMGVAKPWATELAKDLKSLDIVVLNPRRDDWDSSWEQSIRNKQFREQVEWEQDGMDAADLILMVFLEDSKSPVTLLEMGEHVDSGRLMICCPEGFYRKGNVDIVAKRFNTPVFEDIESLVEAAKERIKTELRNSPLNSPLFKKN